MRLESLLTIHLGTFFPAHVRTHQPEALIGWLIHNDAEDTSRIETENGISCCVLGAHGHYFAKGSQSADQVW